MPKRPQWKPGGTVTFPGWRSTPGCGYRSAHDQPLCDQPPRYQITWDHGGGSRVCEYHAAECRTRFARQLARITSLPVGSGDS